MTTPNTPLTMTKTPIDRYATKGLAARLEVSRPWRIDFENDKVPNPGFATVLRVLHPFKLALDMRQSIPIGQLANDWS